MSEKAIAHARRVGDRSQEVTCAGGSIYPLYLLGGWDEALERAHEAEESAMTLTARLSLLDPIYIHAQRGDVEQARRWYGHLVDGASPEDPQGAAACKVYHARVLRAEGNLREALALAVSVFDMRDDLGPATWHLKLAIEELLECALALDETAKASKVLGVLDALRPGELTPFYRAVRARFRGRIAEGPEAAAFFREAEQVYESLGAPFLLAMTQLQHAESLAEQGPTTEAEALCSAARAAFEQLGAKPWLERADRLGAPADDRVGLLRCAQQVGHPSGLETEFRHGGVLPQKALAQRADEEHPLRSAAPRRRAGDPHRPCRARTDGSPSTTRSHSSTPWW